MEQLRVGIVGLGSMAQRHADAGNKNSAMILTAICHPEANRLAEKAAQWNVSKAYERYEDLLADEAVDAVILVTPNNLHAPMTLAALRAGKHVLCEKPPAISAEEAEQVQAAALSCGKLVMYGLMFRFSSKHNAVRELREQGEFGEIFYVKAGIIRRSGSPGGWFVNKAISGGGPLIDLGSHILDLSMYLMGDVQPVSVFARTFARTENLRDVSRAGRYTALTSAARVDDVEELALIVVNFSNGGCLVAETSFASHIKQDAMYLQLQGTRGGATVDPKLEIHTVKNGELYDWIPEHQSDVFDYQQAIDAQLAHFADCILDGAPCRAPAVAGVRLMRVVGAAYESAQTQQLIYL